MEEVYKYLNLDNKENQNSFDTLISWELDNESTVAKKVNIISFLLKLSIGILVSDLVQLFQLQFRKSKLGSVVFVTHYSHILKAIGFNKVFENENYGILYVPTVHSKDRTRHFKQLKENKNVKFDYFGLSTFFKSFLLFFDILFFIKLKKKYPNSFSVLFKNIVKYKIFEFYAEKTYQIGRSVKLWIFDNDRDTNFTPLIILINKRGIPTVSLQHGVFFEGNKFYIPSISKHVFCCSEREKKMFVRGGVEIDKINVIGAPLQTFVHKNSNLDVKHNINIKYDVLILLTSTIFEKEFAAQIKLLNLLANHDEFSVIVRFRPASVHYDREQLDKYISPKFFISDNDLEADIRQSKSIITFSFDALYNCVINNKKIILLCAPEIKKQLSTQTNPLVLNYLDIESIIKYLNLDIPFEKEVFVNNFGEYDFSIYRSNFIDSCKSIMNNLK